MLWVQPDGWMEGSERGWEGLRPEDGWEMLLVAWDHCVHVGSQGRPY